MSKIFLIDGTALIYRAYFAFINNPLRNSSGHNTSAIFGVVNTFLKLLNDQNPEKIIVSFDLKEPTFRHELTDTYKANRPPAPDELISQIDPVKDFFRLLRIPEVSVAGFEADDAIGTLAERYKNDHQVIVITSDKDFAQIVDERINLYDPFSEKLIDAEEVKKKYGVAPPQFVDYLAIIGDSSDNIPGVKGIGAKGAATLLEQFADLDEIYAKIDQIASESLQKKLIEGKDAAYLSRKLARIVTNVPLDKEIEQNLEELEKSADFRKEIFSKIIPYLHKYELNSILNKLKQTGLVAPESDLKSTETDFIVKKPPDVERSTAGTAEPDLFSLVGEGSNNRRAPEEANEGSDVVQLAFDFYNDSKRPEFQTKIIYDQAGFEDLLDQLKQNKVVAIALEPSIRRGSSHNQLLASTAEETEKSFDQAGSPVGIALCADPDTAYYIPLFSRESLDQNSQIFSPNQLTELFASFQAETIIAGHNIKQDYLLLQKQGIELKGTLFDTMIASYLLESGLSRHNLLECVQRELHHELATMDELLGSGKKRQNIRELAIEEVAAFATEDANVIFRLSERYQKRLHDNRLWDLFANLEMPLLKVLAKMEREGVYIDCLVLKEINLEISGEIDKLTKEIYKLAGKEFNINSTQQLSKVLFEDLQMPSVKKTKTGFSTDNHVLEVLAEDFEIAQLLIDYRQLTKLRSTYVESLPQLVSKQTGRIHSSFNQAVTTTGRLSSSNPNLQNIPIRSKAGKEIRKAFTVESEDYLILSADYSQIELRILGILSKDRTLTTAFNHNQDIHAQTAGLILNKPITMITQDERRMAKAINFGIIYGMGANKLARETGISLNEAKQFIEAYFTKFSRIREYIHQQKQKARSYGYAETIMGRRLAIPNIHSSNQRLQSEAERIAVNMPIQGSAADIMKMAMIRLDREFTRINSEADKSLVRMIIQVHDELIFEVHKQELEKIKALVIKEMKNALPEKYRIIIPLVVDAGAGINWFEAHS